MMEKLYEHNQDLHMLFVDFKQAFDSIDRYKLYQVMEDMKSPYKLIRLVKMTMKNTTARVKVTNKLSNSFIFNAGVRQGDDLSTTLFILALQYGAQKIDQRGIIFTKLSQICAYADNIVIVARTQKKLTEVYLDLEEETRKLGMEINEKKLNIWSHPPMNIGEMLGIYELEIKHSKQSRASNTWEISLVTPTIITNAQKREL